MGILTALVPDIIKKGLDLFDKKFETETEKLEAKKNYELEIKTLAMEAVQQEENERSKRHKYDMRSDSWLSKNIRPMILAYTAALLGYTTYIHAPQYIFQGILMLNEVAFGFYFSLRGAEKITALIKKMGV